MKGRMGSSITPEISQAEVRTGFTFKCLKCNIIVIQVLKYQITP